MKLSSLTRVAQVASLRDRYADTLAFISEAKSPDSLPLVMLGNVGVKVTDELRQALSNAIMNDMAECERELREHGVRDIGPAGTRGKDRDGVKGFMDFLSGLGKDAPDFPGFTMSDPADETTADASPFGRSMRPEDLPSGVREAVEALARGLSGWHDGKVEVHVVGPISPKRGITAWAVCRRVRLRLIISRSTRSGSSR